MQYFQTNIQTLIEIATVCGFDGLAGYLILARHATSRELLEYPAYVLSGAGINSIHEKLGCSELRAKSILQLLEKHGFIKPAPENAKAAAPLSARWLLPKQHPLNLDLPHDLVDPPSISSTFQVDSALKRLKKMTPLAEQNKSEANCDATMLLLSMYAANEMMRFGGLSATSTVFRPWQILSIGASSYAGCYEWKMEPQQKMTYKEFQEKSLPHAPKETTNKRFWNALDNILEVGLIYEVVSLFSNEKELLVPLRINDFHAGSVERQFAGDPSLLKEFEVNYGTRLSFYTQEPESMRCILPYKTGNVVGIFRLRFRAGNRDTGIWFENDQERVASVFNTVSQTVGDSYDDDF